jgi:hypothetical protein
VFPVRPAGDVLEREQPLAEGAPWQTPDRITCHLHDTLIEHCIDEHGLDLLEPVAFYFLGSERHR